MPIIRPFILCCLSILLLSACYTATAQDFSVARIPDPMQHGHHVSNPDQLISPAAEQALNLLLDSLDRSGRAQVAVVLLKTIGSRVPKDVAHEIFRTWKPGDREKNNGLVVLLVNDQRRIEFETGYGLEGELPDVVCFRIQQHIMLPYFKQQDYDNGMILGLQAVVSVLRGQDVQTISAPENNTANTFMQAEAPERELPGNSSIILYFIFLVIGSIGFLLLFRRNKPQTGGQNAALAPVLYRPGLMAWIWLFAMPWLVIFCLVNFTTLSVGASRVALILYAHCVIFWCYYIVIASMKASGKTRNSDRYNSYLTWRQAAPHLLPAILFPLPLLPFYSWIRKRLYELRSAPYYCQSCSEAMQRLGEKADDAFLERYQVVEESIKSVDYDVWHCNDCNTLLIYGYDIASSDAEPCPECSHKTLQATGKEIQQAATTSNAGWGWQHYACHFCDFKKKETFSIPATGSSSGSSSGSSGSSSSSGSWGGGSSGGGGAGSSW